jgi:methylenetetrahydrofolate reductase (NADPH)
MKIDSILKTKKLSISFEVFPPKQVENFENVSNITKELSSYNPDFISVTCGAGGTNQNNTAEIASKILSYGTPALAHLTCVGNSVEQIQQKINKLKSSEIKNILALRGDIPQDKTIETATCKELRHASDLIAILKKEGFCTGGACYPEGHPESASRLDDIENLKFKVDAGVDFLTTQMFFDNNMLYNYLYKLQSKGINIPVLAGIMPITNSKQVERMIRLSSAYVPTKLLSICDRFSDDPEAMRQAGIAYATDQIIDLISNDVRGIHIYTMNKPEIAKDILANINSIIKAVNK